MALNTPITWVSGQVVGASDMNTQVRDNFNYFSGSRPITSTIFLNGSDYTTTSTTPVDVDATNLKITLTLSGTRAVIISFAELSASNVSNEACYLVNYSQGLNANGSNRAQIGPNGTNYVTVMEVFTGLTPGSQTFKMRFFVSNVAITGKVRAIEGTNARYYAGMLGWEY